MLKAIMNDKCFCGGELEIRHDHRKACQNTKCNWVSQFIYYLNPQGNPSVRYPLIDVVRSLA